MEQHLMTYFIAEKQEALVFMLVGAFAVLTAAWLLVRGGRYKGMAYPLIAIAAIQATVGSTVYFRTDRQVAALQAQYRTAPEVFKAEEAQRMRTVVDNFRIYRWIEIALLAAGLVLLALRRNDLWFSVGLGLAAQSALMLALDWFAERRADLYLAFITSLQ